MTSLVFHLKPVVRSFASLARPVPLSPQSLRPSFFLCGPGERLPGPAAPSSKSASLLHCTSSARFLRDVLRLHQIFESRSLRDCDLSGDTRSNRQALDTSLRQVHPENSASSRPRHEFRDGIETTIMPGMVMVRQRDKSTSNEHWQPRSIHQDSLVSRAESASPGIVSFPVSK